MKSIKIPLLLAVASLSGLSSVKAQAKEADALTVLLSDARADQDSCVSFAGDGLQTLRMLYAGDGSGSQESCDSPERREMVAGFADAFADCGESECSEGITHAFRLGDELDSTLLFKELVGITQFCNGDQNGDHDPIRRPCTSQERICGSDGTLGLVLPVYVDPDTAFTNQEVNNATPCGVSAFDYMRPRLSLNPIPDCPYGPSQNSIGGLCAYPMDEEGRFGCQARSGFVNRPSLAGSDPDFDPRKFNRVARSFSGRIAGDFTAHDDDPDQYRGSPFYRIAPGCGEEINSATQLACIVDTLRCTVGFAPTSSATPGER